MACLFDETEIAVSITLTSTNESNEMLSVARGRKCQNFSPKFQRALCYRYFPAYDHNTISEHGQCSKHMYESKLYQVPWFLFSSACCIALYSPLFWCLKCVYLYYKSFCFLTPNRASKNKSENNRISDKGNRQARFGSEYNANKATRKW